MNSIAKKPLDSLKKAQKQNDRNGMLMTELQKLRLEIAEMMKQHVLVFLPRNSSVSWKQISFGLSGDLAAFQTSKLATISKDKKRFCFFYPDDTCVFLDS